jgi:hypothetical protein
VTQLAEHDRIRDSIRATIQRQGSRLKHATPATIIATMVAAACMPVVWPLLGVPEPLKAAVDLLGVPAGGFITDFVKEAIGRLRDQDGPKSKSAVQEALERELLACLHANDEHAAALRADAAVLLERVQGVQAALEAAAGDVQQALVQAFSALGATLGEFRWMLDQTRHALVSRQSWFA